MQKSPSIRLFLLVSVLTTILCPFSSNAQTSPDSSLVRIETTDGNEYIGQITYEDEEKITLIAKNIGEITLPRKIIASLTEVKPSEMKGNTYWFDNSYSNTRYFFNPSGYGLPAGTGYYQNTWVLFNQVSYGVTDNISIGAGMVPVFLFAPEAGTPIWFTPKISFPIKKDKVNLGIGALYATYLGSGESGGGGIAYGVATFGPQDNHYSFGAGWGFGFDNGVSKKPTFSFSYMNRGRPKWAFVTENYFISAGNDLLLMSVGARYLGKKISIDMAGVLFLDLSGNDPFIMLPWLGVSVPFGKKK